MRSSIPLLLALVSAAPAFAAPGAVPLDRLPREPAASARSTWGGALRRLVRRSETLRRLAPPTRGRLRLAVVLVAFPDEPPTFAPRAFREALFSRGRYRRTATGEAAPGSLRDYFFENSSGALDVTGRVFDWVQVSTSRAALDGQLIAALGGRRALLGAALDALLAREGPRALDGFDALTFVVAGERAPRQGALTWPHSAITLHDGALWRYTLLHSGRRRFEPIGVHCHELGHVLGILDKYGLGTDGGLGPWCLMASGGHPPTKRAVPEDAPRQTLWGALGRLVRRELGRLRDWLTGERWTRPAEASSAQLSTGRRSGARSGSTRPLHLCAVCKSRLGWSRPARVDPSRPVRLLLRPVEEDASQVVRVPLDRRGREALVLEYRTRRGFDGALPAPGLLVWRAGSPTAFTRTFVPFEQVELLPAHGLRSLDAARRALERVPFPSGARRALEASGTLPGSWRVRLEGIALTPAGLEVTVRRVR